MKKLVEVIPGWATTEAAAAYLGLSLQHVRRIGKEKLGAVEVGKNTLLYPAKKIREFKKLPVSAVGRPRGSTKEAAR